MAKRVKVVINRKAWGANVMSGADITALVESRGQAVASHLDGGTVETFAAAVRGGGSRVRARVSHDTSTREEADSNALIAALSAVLPLARR